MTYCGTRFGLVNAGVQQRGCDLLLFFFGFEDLRCILSHGPYRPAKLLPVPLLLGRTVAPGVLLPLGVRLDLSRKTSKPWEVKNIPKNFEDEIAQKLT